jgi:hypothetical protein
MSTTRLLFWALGAIVYMFKFDCMADQPSSQNAIAIERIFRDLEIDIPFIPGIMERSLMIPCEGKWHSAAQLEAWSKRVVPIDDESREVAWKYAKSTKSAVRYIACCAICRDTAISYSSFPENISIFHALKDRESLEFQRLIQWLEKEVKKNLKARPQTNGPQPAGNGTTPDGKKQPPK